MLIHSQHESFRKGTMLSQNTNTELLLLSYNAFKTNGNWFLCDAVEYPSPDHTHACGKTLSKSDKIFSKWIMVKEESKNWSSHT